MLLDYRVFGCFNQFISFRMLGSYVDFFSLEKQHSNIHESVWQYIPFNSFNYWLAVDKKIGSGIPAKILSRIQNICLHDIKQIPMNNSLYLY